MSLITLTICKLVEMTSGTHTKITTTIPCHHDQSWAGWACDRGWAGNSAPLESGQKNGKCRSKAGEKIDQSAKQNGAGH